MDAKTLEALRGSIAKWEAIVAGTEIDRGIDNCPLCQLFNVAPGRTADDCVGCPVMEATGLKYCDGTPYEFYDDGSESIAGGELVFLKSLLPPEPL